MNAASLAPPLRTGFARLLLVAFAVVHVALAIGPGPTAPGITAVALAAIVAAAAIVVLVPGDRLAAAWTAAVVVLAVGADAVVVPLLPGAGWPGYASWPLGATTFVAIGLALRRRIAAAWLAEGSMTALGLLWSGLHGTGPLVGLGLVDRQLGVLLIGALFAVGLRRAGSDHDALAALQQQEALVLGSAERERRARQEAVRRVLEETGPTLERIAAGGRLDDRERGRALALEGRLRDGIALGPILSDALGAALASARGRGVDVVVLTEPAVSAMPTATLQQAAAWLAARLDAVQDGSFVGRVVPRGAGVRVSATSGAKTEDRVLVPGE